VKTSPGFSSKVNVVSLASSGVSCLGPLGEITLSGGRPKGIGCLGIGSDADMVLLDLKARERLNSRSLCYIDEEGKWSPYENWAIRAVPRMTILRGEIIMREGQMLVKPGFGQRLTVLGSSQSRYAGYTKGTAIDALKE